MALSLFDGDRVAAIERLHAATALYTVEPVVRDLFARVTWPRRDARLLDPSCGDGAFLGIAVDLLLSALPDLPDEDLVRAVQGWEIHAGACAQAREHIGALLKRYGRVAAIATSIVHEGDYLTDPAARRERAVYDVVVGNPPYLRFVNVPALLRMEYEGVLPAWARGDLLHAFLDRCAEALLPDGELALVTADRWLFNVSCANLRAALGRTLRLAHVARLDAATAFYRPKNRKPGTPPRIHPVAIVLSAGGDQPVTAEPFYPEANSATRGIPLGEIARVQIAPWVGPLGVFLVDEATRARVGAEVIPAIDTDDLRADGSVAAPTRYVFAAAPDREPGENLGAYLRANLHRLPPRARQRSAWWMPPERVDALDLSQPRLVVPRIAKDLKAFRVPAGVLPINHNLTIVAEGSRDLHRVQAAIDSEDARRWIHARAARLENGYLSITTRLLRELPLDL